MLRTGQTTFDPCNRFPRNRLSADINGVAVRQSAKIMVLAGIPILPKDFSDPVVFA
jgi:hypothetical protein